MAVLQAARASRLGLPIESAYSWGLNRAIFYAAAKAGFRRAGPAEGVGSGAPREVTREPYQVGDDHAFRDPRATRLYFTIGDATQTEKEFEQQVIARFGEPRLFDTAWKEARALVDAADEEALRSGPAFYERVYRPHRDELRARWAEMVGVPATGGGLRPRRRAD